MFFLLKSNVMYTFLMVAVLVSRLNSSGNGVGIELGKPVRKIWWAVISFIIVKMRLY